MFVFLPENLKQIKRACVPGWRAAHDWLRLLYYLTAVCFQVVSRLCCIDYYFSPPQKRLMSPENSTRKVNTILKCREINDIVLSSYDSIREGDKCLALFTPILPICDLSLCPPHCLCLRVYFSFILHVLLADRDVSAPLPRSLSF